MGSAKIKQTTSTFRGRRRRRRRRRRRHSRAAF